MVPACGGADRPTSIVVENVAPIDRGSGAVNCSVVDGYEFLNDPTHSENFETGAATGWYTNNEVCYPWTQAVTECAEGGFVCYPGSQASAQCLQDGAPPAIWSNCFGTAPIDCADAGGIFTGCQSQCLTIQRSPSFTADQLPAELIPNGGRCGSLYALHIVGGPFANWGGNVGTRFPRPFDASGWDGIAVWMRTATGFANAPRVAISDPHTDSQFNMSPPDGASPFCNPNPNCQAQFTTGNTNCYQVGCDQFGAYTPLTENWRLYLLSFDEMRQGGWGRQEPLIDLTQILSIQINYTQGSWDFWVDDITFYRRKPQ